jgi:signal transduction histidine kinase
VRTLCTILFALSLTVFASAQERNQIIIDSLEQVLTTTLPDSQRLKVNNHLLNFYSDVNTERFIELAEESMKLINNSTNKVQIATAYFNIAMATESKGEYTNSLVYNAKALQLFQAMGDSVTVGSILNNIGISYNQMGDYSMAVYYLLKAAEMDEARKDLYSSSIDYINLSESYYSAKIYNISVQWAQKAYRQLTTIKDEQSIGYAAEMLAMAYIEVNKFDSARYYIRIAQTLGAKFDNEYLITRSTSHLGRIHLKIKNYDSAAYYLTKTVQQSKGKNQSDVLLPATLALSRCLMAQGNLKDALIHARWAYASSLEIKNKVIATESCMLLAALHEKAQNKEETILYLKLASEYREEILQQSVQGSLQAKAFDVILEKEKRAKQATEKTLIERGKILVRQRFMLAGGAIVVLTLLTLLYLLRKINVERKKTNEQLTLNNIQLDKLNEEISGLIHTIVHDLKSPLNSMEGILNLLALETKNSPSATELMNQGHKVIARGNEIIHELLELRELEEKPISLQLEKINLKIFTDQLASEYLTYANQKEITLNVSGADTEVKMDKQIVKRLIDNLISNAIKYSPKGKSVTVNSFTRDHNLIFEIIDQGPGFKPADLEKMYSKFQRLSATPTGGESSNGLGLAIVDLLVKRLEATIHLDTEWGNGSTFVITIPAVSSTS